jgi:hypothetical protein
VSINCNFITDPAFQTDEKLKGRKKRFEVAANSQLSELCLQAINLKLKKRTVH